MAEEKPVQQSSSTPSMPSAPSTSSQSAPTVAQNLTSPRQYNAPLAHSPSQSNPSVSLTSGMADSGHGFTSGIIRTSSPRSFSSLQQTSQIAAYHANATENVTNETQPSHLASSIAMSSSLSSPVPESSLTQQPQELPTTLPASPTAPDAPQTSSLSQTTNTLPASPVSTATPPPNVQPRMPAVESRTSSATSPIANGHRPLNVKDALTYLDQVKFQFPGQPEVYNKFLDIMKDFKSQAIDTPGVIERVSTLFRGHPSLIQVFNTFLPPGYHIECSTDEHERDVIKVTTPSGTTCTTDGEPLNLSSVSSVPSSGLPRYYPQPASFAPCEPPMGYGPASRGVPGNIASATNGGLSSPVSAYPHHHSHHGLQMHSSPNHVMDESTANSNRRPPVEFNHAINYVNKIKNRFADDPETYKQFLEILQTYQKEQKPIQEANHLQILFNGAQDLLDEFKQFLPDASASHAAGAAALFGASQSRASFGTGKKSIMTHNIPSIQGRKKRVGASNIPGLAKGSKRTKIHHKMDLQTSDVRSGLPLEEEVLRPTISAEEAEFFERVKKYIGNKTTYNAFLKVLNLFSQQIVDQNVLVSRVEGFIGGNKELFDWFKSLVGYDGKDEVIENVPADVLKPDWSQCEAYGPSYRSVPKSWQKQTCSGRDSLCWEVLNDEYVSHPTWASEDSGFVASKKNQYEEALHRVEEERYDYDLNIEANLNTIALLEPIAKKISIMSTEEKVNFRLPLGLGGPSKTIYQRILKKIYGSERGLEIIELLHNNPAQTVPIVLKRLKQKDDEWKRAQREWNKIWREVEAKNYWKSLDYQGIIFKSNDKKAMTTKSLISEIDARRTEQREKPKPSAETLLTKGGQGPQFAFTFQDEAVFKDVSRILYSFFDQQTTFSVDECDNMRLFLETFLPLMFNITDIIPDISPGMDVSTEIAMDEDDYDEDESRSMQSYDSDNDLASNATTSRRTRSRRSMNQRSQATDEESRLLKDVLTRNINKSPVMHNNENEENRKIKQEHEDDKVSETDVLVLPLSENNAQAAEMFNSSSDVDKRVSQPQEKESRFSLFGDNHIYCFLRLYQMVYERLFKMKALQEHQKDVQSKWNVNGTAIELGVVSKRLSSVRLDVSYGRYNALLSIIEKFFEEELDQQLYEECARYVFGPKVYIMFTIDKILLSLTRHLQYIVSDNKTRALIELFKETRELNTQSLKACRQQADAIAGSEENLYYIEFNTKNSNLSIQLLNDDDPDRHMEEKDAYETYVTNYIDWAKETEGIDQSNLTPRLLQRLRGYIHSKTKGVITN
ncbi:Transcriptional regulatory protein sin3 [Apophysomyces ossiformis]|uniref:Transcriptional regulatory protein sin3 n=1 Tax=Apophysomyces ossiformis TaxID=679940 RepID=A0A8H7BDA3_9FUNG|nr:Transcriptional regulatory protein sin3 [Apophysomyces ossiformis]